MNGAKSLIPPSFVNVPSDPVYDADLSDAQFRTYVRLRGLAWQSRYRKTPPLRIEELAEICHHNVRSTWGHLSALRDLGLVTWRTVRGRMVFDLQPLQDFAADDAGGAGQGSRGQSELLQNFAVDGAGGDDPGPQERRQGPELLQNFAVDDAGQAAQNPQALQNFAVNPPPLQNFAVDGTGQAAQDPQALQNFAVDDAGDTVQDCQERPELLQNFAVNPPPLQNFAVEPLQKFAVNPPLLQNFAVDDAGGDDPGPQERRQGPELLQKFAVNPPSLQKFAVGQALQNFAVDYDDGVIAVADSPDQKQQQPSPSSPSLQKFAVTEREAANLAALAAYGVDVGVGMAQETARLAHVTPDLVRAWGEYLRGRPCQNLPGLLLHKLRTTQHPPRTGEQRGGNRQASAVSSQDALPIPERAEQPEREIVTVDAATGLLKRRQARGDRDAVALLLEDFGIAPPASSQVIARSPDPGDVRGWMLYALSQPGLDGKTQGYVVNRLLAGETPPGRFRRWAQMEPDEWRALWHAGRYGGMCAVDADLAAWREDFAGVFRRGPFGDGQRLAPEAEPAIASPDEGSPLAAEWEAVLDNLRLQMTQATFDAWLKGSELVRCEGETFVVGVANTYAKDWLEHRLLPVITRTLARRVGHPAGVEFVVPEAVEVTLA